MKRVMQRLLILLIPWLLLAEPGMPPHELRQDETIDASRNYSNPSYQGNVPPNDDWHNSPNNDNYFDDPRWPDVPDGRR